MQNGACGDVNIVPSTGSLADNRAAGVRTPRGRGSTTRAGSHVLQGGGLPRTEVSESLSGPARRRARRCPGYPIAEAIQSAIAIVGRTEEVSIAAIAGAVAHYFRMKLSDLRSSSRKQKLVRARSLSMLLARRLTSKSMHHIGGYFGGRDHSTVLHAIRKTESLLVKDADLRRAADEVSENLSAT